VTAKVLELTAQGRPVLVGTTDVETSEILSRMFRMRGIQHQVLNAKQHAREAEVVRYAGQAGTVTIATNMAGRGTDIKLPQDVKDAGGLAIIGTERHDSRRVDRQLRGRSGRQGDPGSSIFYVSLEDKLMRLFGSERIAGIVDKLGMKDDEALESSMLSKSIENAQKKVEEINFGSRKRLLEYDDIMNSQREAIYSKRRNALSGERIEIDVMNMMQDLALVLAERAESMSYEEFVETVQATLSVDLTAEEVTASDMYLSEELYSKAKADVIADLLLKNMMAVYNRRMGVIIQRTLPIFKSIAEKEGVNMPDDAKIRIPVSDGRRIYPVVVNIKKTLESEGRELVRAISKCITLYRIDESWKEHLREMDDLKQSVQNATYEQKDPLLIYKFESFNLFSTMLEDLSKHVSAFLLRANIPLGDGQPVNAPAPRKPDLSRMNTSRTDLVTNAGEPKSKMPVHVDKQVGRNDPCPCGSGKKFKNCHGKAMA
jgi:preprotein translocase subunit SecA